MSITGQSGVGRIILFNDFCGPEIPVANLEAATTPGHLSGPFKVTGDLVEADTGIVGLSKSSGYVRISGNDEDGKGVFVGTEVVFSPALNGTMVCECRLELQALTARVVFVGFMGANASDVAEPITSTATTCTRATNAVGFLLDSQITAGTKWHMPYMISTTASQTATAIASSQVAVIAESDVLRVEVDNNGAARWFINGVLEKSIGAALAADTTTLMAAGVGCWGTTTIAADADVDYLLVEANRDWTR